MLTENNPEVCVYTYCVERIFKEIAKTFKKTHVGLKSTMLQRFVWNPPGRRQCVSANLVLFRPNWLYYLAGDFYSLTNRIGSLKDTLKFYVRLVQSSYSFVYDSLIVLYSL